MNYDNFNLTVAVNVLAKKIMTVKSVGELKMVLGKAICDARSPLQDLLAKEAENKKIPEDGSA